jgi:hypothetical protein
LAFDRPVWWRCTMAAALLYGASVLWAALYYAAPYIAALLY